MAVIRKSKGLSSTIYFKHSIRIYIRKPHDTQHSRFMRADYVAVQNLFVSKNSRNNQGVKGGGQTVHGVQIHCLSNKETKVVIFFHRR